ncbi:MAG: hypothetical protein GTO14_08695 [Anaerolineales bacterium]|nr:hypothetical protein [Anaerolineales bacterium]
MKIKRNVIRKKPGRKKSIGQSLVEFAVLLPILIMMLSGLVEFGFLLNIYLDLIDAAREAARFSANDDPVRLIDGTPTDLNPLFYSNAQTLTKESLKTSSDDRIDWLPPFDDCDNIDGDIVISTFSILDGVIDTRYPTIYGDSGVSLCGHYFSEFTTAEVNARLDAAAPNAGLVLVEIFVNYNHVLGLPWIRAFVPDPVLLHAYSFMPNTAVEPTPTPP